MKTDDFELVKMSMKGQLVVPQDVRAIAQLSPGERFVAFPVQEGVLFKRVEMPEVKLDFESLSKEVEAQFKKGKVSKKDVKEAIRWARKR
jgi:bifunctional DNA-binding transcriptional regulator/antitoxin component of YhaV-PrlF toxin-antitoxin module